MSGRFDLESITGYDALVHLAYCVEEPRDKRQAFQVNVVATRTLLDEANRVGIGHLVLTSSANALGVAACGTGEQLAEDKYPAGDRNPGNYYFYHKALLEHLANWYWANAAEGSTKLAVARPCYIVGEHFDNSAFALFSRSSSSTPSRRVPSINSCGTQTLWMPTPPSSPGGFPASTTSPQQTIRVSRRSAR